MTRLGSRASLPALLAELQTRGTQPSRIAATSTQAGHTAEIWGVEMRCCGGRRKRSGGTVPSSFYAVCAFAIALVSHSDPSHAADGKSRATAGARFPKIYASSAVVLDAENGTLLFAKNEKELRPIASITKLMTALVFVETGESLRSRVIVEPIDREGASRTIFRAGEEVTAHDLLFAALLNSDNVAARCLAKASRLPPGEFVARMNRKARLMGLVDMHFEDPTGLDPRNVATALDCAALVESATRDPFLRTILMTQEHSFHTGKRLHILHSTNRLLHASDTVIVGKTGFIEEAGYCFASCFDSAGRDLAVVVLGARSPSARFREANDLIHWALDEVAR